MLRGWIITCGIVGALGVALGAYGAHAAALLDDPAAGSRIHTAVAYHFYHVAALFGTILLANIRGDHWILRASRWLFLVGILCFSGSLYWLTLVSELKFPGITPMGGLLLIGGWLALAGYGLIQQKATSD